MMRTVRLQNPRGQRVLLAGGILGLAEDGPQMRALLEAEAHDRILLGIPFEDLDAIRATSGKERAEPFERDETDEVYLRELAKFGRVEVPPSDLYVAYQHAEARGVPVEAIDLGDEGHTNVWTKEVGMFELLRNNRRLRRLGQEAFIAKNAEDFASEWDAKIFPTKGLRRVQLEREAWMAKRVAEVAQAVPSLFVLVPLARWAGIRERLARDADFAVIG